MFKKSKRSFRQRIRQSDSDEEEKTESATTKSNDENAGQIVSEKVPTSTLLSNSNSTSLTGFETNECNDSSQSNDEIVNRFTGKTNKTKSKLSFHAEDEEEEDVFVVKKTNYSRRMERNKKKLLKSASSTQNSNQNNNNNSLPAITVNTTEETTNELVKDSNSSAKNNNKEDDKEVIVICPDSEDDEDSDVQYCGASKNRSSKKSNPHVHEFRDALERGYIPDANVIYELKKQRQQLARTVNDEFIPLESGDDDEQNQENKRLDDKRMDEGEEDDDEDEDDERIQFGKVDYKTKEKEKAKEIFRMAQQEKQEEELTAKNNNNYSDDDELDQDVISVPSDNSEDELERWEREQIRKAIRLPATYDYSDMEFQNRFIVQNEAFKSKSKPLHHSQFSQDNHNVVPIEVDTQPTNSFGSLIPSYISDRSTKQSELNFDLVKDKVSGSKKKMQSSIEDYDRLYDRVCMDLKLTLQSIDLYESEKQRFTDDYNFYRNLLDFSRNLCDCINDKLQDIEKCEQLAMERFQCQATKTLEESRADVTDMNAMCFQLLMNHKANCLHYQPYQVKAVCDVYDFGGDESKRSRAIRRENKYRSYIVRHEIDSASDTNSSDEEQDEENQKEIETKLLEIFEDTEEDYATVRGVLHQFELWKQTRPDTYSESFIEQFLPKFLIYYIRYEMVGWNLFRKKEPLDLVQMKCFQHLILYDCPKVTNGKTQEKCPASSATPDDDLNLIPSLVDSTVLARLCTMIEKQIWNPLSLRQTTRFAKLLSFLVETFPTLIDCGSNLPLLLRQIVLRIEKTIETDIFIPQIIPADFFNHCPPSTGATNSYETLVVDFVCKFFHRQFTKTVKLMANIIAFRNIIKDSVLKELAMEKLFHRYLLLSIQRSASDQQGTLSKIRTLVSLIPAEWRSPLVSNPIILKFADLIQQLIDSPTLAYSGPVREQLTALKIELVS